MNDYLHLLSKYLSGEASPEEAMALDEWVNASPENKTTFEEYFKLYEAAGRPGYTLPDTSTAWSAVEKGTRTGFGRGSAGFYLISAAGISVLLLGGVYFFTRTAGDKGGEKEPVPVLPATEQVAGENRDSSGQTQKAAETVSFDKKRLAVFSFNNTRLTDALQEIEQAYGVSIKVPDKKFNNCFVTAYFDHKELEEVMSVLSFTLKFNYQADKDGKNYLIFGDGCE
ncbi:DUF4974 domain-containing protein [Flavihumibacter sp. CACIAM 22H1]|uniref:DUF4974 domain-containing protein n=1 Tax=Flavihumibacter sp. CACIAM 22H1 TaxID=1812911 RepID=UPI0007A8A470|nr:DUF4974 domain-containing protein [Flavihumibacter sp. CACIAM 22H1]KYP12976.1 MAG: hypothetical protein A1D16_19550 [Flavihumibacter sp. CACIAM 22H1]